MAETKLPSDITNTLNTVVDHIQQKTIEAKSLSVVEAEKLLDDAINNCKKTLDSKMEDIRASVKRGRPDPSSATYDEENKKYSTYIAVVASSIASSASLIDAVFKRIRNIVSTAVEWIRTNATWMWTQLNEAFTAIKSLWIS